jgi:uncharacterized protein
VPRLGPKAFEQCAGFLRITGGLDPLDATSVHPEAYPVVRRMAAVSGGELGGLIGNTVTLRRIQPTDFVDERFGLPTVTDILKELEKPGRDPRPAFKTAEFADGVEKISDLTPGMLLEGVVTNVAAFGAFVDVGVHQDGLVHVSALSRTFVKDPREVVKPGDIVRVKVLDVDIPRKRISLTLRLEDEATPSSGPREAGGGGRPRGDSRGGSGGSGGGGGRGDSRGGGGRSGGDSRGGSGGGAAGRSGGGGGRSGGGGGGGGAPIGGGALADALRRAGLDKGLDGLKDQPKQQRRK